MIARIKSWGLMALAAIGAFLGLTAYVYRQQRDDARADASQARAEQARQEREYDRRMAAHAAEMEAASEAAMARAEVGARLAHADAQAEIDRAANDAATTPQTLADRVNAMFPW